MRSAFALAFLTLVTVACASPAPTSRPPTTPAPTATLVPLPGNLSGIPTDEEFTADVSPQTPDGELTIGEERDYTIGHCGVSSPTDIDGSLWDPIGSAAALTEPQEGELINATSVVVVLLDENTMEMHTPAGAVITLSRHDGPRRYFLCD